MTLQNAPIATFNRGIVDTRALARVDIKRIALAAETQTNWMPRTLGSMIFRPGLEYIDSTYSNAEAVHIPFIFSIDETSGFRGLMRSPSRSLGPPAYRRKKGGSDARLFSMA